MKFVFTCPEMKYIRCKTLKDRGFDNNRFSVYMGVKVIFPDHVFYSMLHCMFIDSKVPIILNGMSDSYVGERPISNLASSVRSFYGFRRWVKKYKSYFPIGTKLVLLCRRGEITKSGKMISYDVTYIVKPNDRKDK